MTRTSPSLNLIDNMPFIALDRARRGHNGFQITLDSQISMASRAEGVLQLFRSGHSRRKPGCRVSNQMLLEYLLQPVLMAMPPGVAIGVNRVTPPGNVGACRVMTGVCALRSLRYFPKDSP